MRLLLGRVVESHGDIIYVYHMRTLIDLPDTQIQHLAALCERVKQPRAAIIRAAVDEYLARHKPEPLQAGFGLWGKAGPDGLEYQRDIRAEW